MRKVNILVVNKDEGSEVFLAGAEVQVPHFTLQCVRELLEAENYIKDEIGYHVTSNPIYNGTGSYTFETPYQTISVEASDLSTIKIPQKRGGEVSKYKLIDYFDVWGNSDEGYWVNNQCTAIEEVEIPHDAVKEDIIRILQEVDYLGESVIPDMFEVVDDGGMIEIFRDSDMYPIGLLQLIEYSEHIVDDMKKADVYRYIRSVDKSGNYHLVDEEYVDTVLVQEDDFCGEYMMDALMKYKDTDTVVSCLDYGNTIYMFNHAGVPALKIKLRKEESK